MKDFLNFIKRNRVVVALISIILICLIICFVFGFKLFWGDTSSNKYGARLDDVESYPFTDQTVESIKEYFLKNEKVDSVNINIQGKIVYITVDFNTNLALKTAKTLTSGSLKKIDSNLLKHYEIQYILTASKVKKSKIYPTMGYKALKKSSISWINN